jgi:hypothetical protein
VPRRGEWSGMAEVRRERSLFRIPIKLTQLNSHLVELYLETLGSSPGQAHSLLLIKSLQRGRCCVESELRAGGP